MGRWMPDWPTLAGAFPASVSIHDGKNSKPGLVARLRKEMLEPFRQQRHDLEQIPDDTVIGNAENRGFGVFVYGDDDPGLAHARQMLDSAADAAGDVKLGGNGFARLPDLERVVAISGIARAARGADRAAERSRERLQRLEARRAANASAAGDDDVGFGKVYAAGGFARDAANDGAGRRRGEWQRRNYALPAVGNEAGYGQVVRADRDDPRSAREEPPPLERLSGVERAGEDDVAAVRRLDGGDVCDVAGPQSGGHAGRELAPDSGVAEHDHARPRRFGSRADGGGVRRRREQREGGVVDNMDDPRPPGGELGGGFADRRRLAACQDGVHSPAVPGQLPGDAERFKRYSAQLAVQAFCEYEHGMAFNVSKHGIPPPCSKRLRTASLHCAEARQARQFVLPAFLSAFCLPRVAEEREGSVVLYAVLNHQPPDGARQQ